MENEDKIIINDYKSLKDIISIVKIFLMNTTKSYLNLFKEGKS